MDGELTSLEKLIELSRYANVKALTEQMYNYHYLSLLHKSVHVWCRHFTAQHLDWKAHRWCNVDTVLLANATALQMDQLRNLPQYCAQWDLYKKLCSAVAELQVLP